MSHYKIIKEAEAAKNGIKLVEIFNTRSKKVSKGFVYPNGIVEIMVGVYAQLKRIKLA